MGLQGEGEVCISTRALLDPGSQSNYITTECANKLTLRIRKSNMVSSGIGNGPKVVSRGITSAILCSRLKNMNFNYETSFIVLDEITHHLPTQQVFVDTQTSSSETCLDDLTLADPRFNIPGKVELLLGAKLWPRILLPDMKFSPYGVAHNTVFGWIVVGGVDPYCTFAFHSTTSPDEDATYQDVNNELNTLLKKFWELEGIGTAPTLTKEEEFCEINFERTMKRNSTGRFIVTIPVDPNAAILGRSKHTAVKRFLQTEKKITAGGKYREDFINFMRDYETLGHMKKITTPPPAAHYYVPYHAVAVDTKFRVVFDGSAKASSGNSFNQIQYNKPKLQDDLWAIINRFRFFIIALTADIEKMYRQILVDESQWDM